MPGLHHPVHLSRSAPFDIDDDQILFYDVIDSEAMSRSRVLSCVAEGGGEAKLPDLVTVSDFRKWLSAVSDPDAVFRSRSFASMCTIIKVADAVDDKLIDGWVRIAAERLKEHALTPKTEEISNDVLEGLSQLPEQLQHRTFGAAAFDPRQLDQLLVVVPEGLHSAVLAALTTRKKTLRMPFASESRPALKALASLPSCPPSVLELHIDNQAAEQHNKFVGQAVWSGLSQALHHHSGLTSFLLSSRSTGASQSSLLPHVAKLSSLRSLDLKGCMLHQHSVLTLPAILEALTQLQTLRLRLSVRIDISFLNRQRDGKPQPQHCLASMLTGATALTSLYIHVAQRIIPGHRSSFTAAAPLHMPQLIDLAAIFEDNAKSSAFAHDAPSFHVDVSMAARFFSNLTAPLTSLTIGKGGLLEPRLRVDTAAGDYLQLLHSLATFTQLRCLSAVLPTNRHIDASRSSAAASALVGLIAALHQPLSLAISADHPVLHSICWVLTTTLTRLHLCHVHARLSQGFLQDLCQLNLQDLSLHIVQDTPPTAFPLAALSSLTQLTALYLRGRNFFCLDAGWQALAALTCLQELCLGDQFQPVEVPEACLTSLHSLRALTALTVMTRDCGTDVVKDGLAARPLRALQELQLALYDPFNTVEDLACYVATLPALRQLTLFLRLSDHYDGDDTGDSDDTDAADPAEERRALAEDCITRAAADSGVELSVQH